MFNSFTHYQSRYIYIYIYLFRLYHVAWGILVPWPGIKPVPPAVEAGSPNQWTARELPPSRSLTILSLSSLTYETPSWFMLTLFIYLFIFGCVRSQVQHMGPSLRHVGSSTAAWAPCCSVWAPEHVGSVVVVCGLSSCGPCAQ